MLTIDDVKYELLEVIRDEAWRGPVWLRANPRRIGRLLSGRLRPRYRTAFSAHLSEVLKDNGFRSLSVLVDEMVVEYFKLLACGGVEPRLVRRGGF